MKNILHILFSLSFIVIASYKSLGQTENLPMACVGSTEKYWVKGLNGHSVFSWKITDQDGRIVPSTFYRLLGSGRGDTIQVEWKEPLEGGIYTFEVIEHRGSGPLSCGGGDGEPYRQDIVLNSPTVKIPFEGVPTSVAVCFGEQAKLDPGQFKSYLWQDGTTERIYYTGESGTYQVKLTDSRESCSYNEIEAKINPLPFVWLGNDTVLFGDQSITLDAYDPKIMIYKWSDNSILPSLTLSNFTTGNRTVWVKVTDENSCSNSDTILLTALKYDELRIPKAFTPNGDGINDKWFFPAPPANSGIGQDLFPLAEEVSLKIFNRWGRLVWEANNAEGWDGKDLKGNNLPMDSYHYLIRFKIADQTFTFKGTVTIIR